MTRFEIKTSRRDEFVDVTGRVRRCVEASGTESGIVVVYVPHTTAGITINENADPDVVHDMIKQLDEMIPWRQPFYRHGEGNSAAHVKASLMGSSVQVFIEQGRLCLGRWQGIWFCEFDGPRMRTVQVEWFDNSRDREGSH